MRDEILSYGARCGRSQVGKVLRRGVGLPLAFAPRASSCPQAVWRGWGLRRGEEEGKEREGRKEEREGRGFVSTFGLPLSLQCELTSQRWRNLGVWIKLVEELDPGVGENANLYTSEGCAR